MADPELEWLKERFRAAVDDIDLDPTDQSGLLWSDTDILEYIDAAHAQFIHDTLYRHELLNLTVVAEDPIIPLPDKVIELRGTSAYIVSSGRQISEINLESTAVTQDDYGATIGVNPFATQPPGEPRAFSLDIENDEIRLFPASDKNDTLQVPAYLEAKQIYDWNTPLDIKNKRHIRMLLNGIRARAFAKQDADAFDPSQQREWQEAFERDIQSVMGERRMRARRPQTIRYGGL